MDTTERSHLLHKGAEEFIDECYHSAIQSFTQLLELHKDNFHALLYRASVYIKLQRFSDAIRDLDQAETINEKSFEVFYKRGIAYFYLEDFVDANNNFSKALMLAQHSEQRDKLIVWTNKLDIELDERNLKTKISNSTEIKFHHTWFQTPSHVILNLESNNNINSEDFNFSIEKKLIKITHRHSNTTVFEIHIANSVIPEQSSLTFNNNKAELKLKKEIENFNWITIDRSKVEEQSNSFKPSYPTSSKVKKNWDNLEKEISKELQEDAKMIPMKE